MNDGELSPFDVNDQIHKFHDGVSQELFSSFSGSLPWFAVCGAHVDGILTDDDLTGARETVLDGTKKFAVDYATLHDIETATDSTEGR